MEEIKSKLDEPENKDNVKLTFLTKIMTKDVSLMEIIKKIFKNIYKLKWLKNAFTITSFYIYSKYIKGNKGIYVTEKEWDNLIILDACRHDLFEEVLGKKSESIISRGSSTPEFLIENFKDKKFEDIVYVTANPFVNILLPNTFFKIVPLWKFAWDTEHNTVMPKKVVSAALMARRAYPNKRIIIHFMQPHQPFIGSGIESSGIDTTGINLSEDIDFNKNNKTKKSKNVDSWQLPIKGKTSITDVYKAYKKNLEFVMPYALKLGKELNGKTIITSDHGNSKRKLFGFIRIYGHPSYTYLNELVKVPFHGVE